MTNPYRTKSLLDLAATIPEQPGADDTQPARPNRAQRRHQGKNGSLKRTPMTINGAGRKDNAPPTMLRRGQNR